jgi:hypothetical protein
MARRDTQGYQIAVVSLLIVWVITTVFMFFFANKYKTAAAQSEKDQADARTAQNGIRKAEEDMSKLKQWMGFEPTASLTDIETAAKADWARYAPTLGEAQRTYRASLETVGASLAEAQHSLNIAQTEVQTLKDYNQAREVTKDKQIAEHRQELEKTRSDLLAMTSAYDQDKKRLETTRDDLARQVDNLRTDKGSLEQKYQQESEQWAKTDSFRKAEIKERQRKIAELQGEVAAPPDGAITEVDQRLGMVWINLGEADGLKRQVSFSVYSQDNNGVAKGNRKAAIEVVQVLGPHSAQARILEDQIKDPIIRGDQIYTPLWQPGRPERFALAGLMDIDGDGKSDRDMVRELIRMNGGVIDAEIDEAGQQIGQLSYETRYVVLGGDAASDPAAGKMKSQAEDLGIAVLSLNKFLDHVGWKNTNQTLLYNAGRHRDFKGPEPDGGRQPARGYTSETFRPRHPREPARPKVSTFDASRNNP